MLMANGSPKFWPLSGGLADCGDGAEEYNDGLCFDLESMWEMLGDDTDPSQGSAENASLNLNSQGLTSLEGPSSSLPYIGRSAALTSSYTSETSDSRTGLSDGLSECAGTPVVSEEAKPDPTLQLGPPAHSFSSGVAGWTNVQSLGMSCSSGNYSSQNASSDAQHVDIMIRDNGLRRANKVENFGTCAQRSSAMYTHMSSNAADTSPSWCGTENLDVFDPFSIADWSSPSDLVGYTSLGQFSPSDFGYKLPSACIDESANLKNEEDQFCVQNSSSAGLIQMNSILRKPNRDEEAKIVNSRGFNLNDQAGSFLWTDHEIPFSTLNGGHLVKETSNLLMTQSTNLKNEQYFQISGENNDVSIALYGKEYRSSEVMHEDSNGESLICINRLSGSKPSAGSLNCSLSENDLQCGKDGKDSLVLQSGPQLSNGSSHGQYADTKAADPSYPMQSASSDLQFSCLMSGSDNKVNITNISGYHISGSTNQAINHRSLIQSYDVDNDDDDEDICILEHRCEPPRGISFKDNRSIHVAKQRSTVCNTSSHMEVGNLRHRANDEKFIFQVALQDLSQPKSEDSPPDGVLAVPLLRHQRIALSWMVKKEKTVIPCSGGILADDQGLGKTISTIALILKERSPSAIHVTENKTETLNLDDDEDVVEEVDRQKQCIDVSQANGCFGKAGIASAQGKGRPAAGTLIVCPTSVLRQWAEELHNKVTGKANLSVLVYHGGNRTRDPLELAKYDVVLTTYSIVSMEVPKQPIDEDDDETGKKSRDAPFGFSSSKKRKYPPSSGKKTGKCKKGVGSDVLEATARPLARVGWFRVVLDEAQSIKNHRTQVARACWGLRAKRRWCLSGTPIQNAVDDLYSYFRFLRYEPLAVYKSFCEKIKCPIQRNPTNGYRKLQAVLKTIMLRRTKGTLLDGKPIINLPPKTIELKKVEFTMEERDFYCRLEADSRAQFAEYAAAGTVKQNYVNILLMLLRLRQACDHPLLVRGLSSSSVWRSSVEMAKKLPKEKQVFLLNCLEASLAICRICSDPPEDAVVTTCGHVFCSQCVRERLTVDDSQCPAANCKNQLTVSSLFSIETLRSSLYAQPSNMATDDDSSSFEVAEASKSCTVECSYDSSKIRAALEVLQSLSKPCHSMPTSFLRSNNDNTCLSGNSPDFCTDQQNANNSLDIEETSNSLVRVAGEKAIVFSQWTRMLDLLETCLKSSSIQYRRLDGTMSVVARDKAVKDFNTLPEVSVMIMSLKAASLGLNMIAACHVLLLDLWWNPTTEDQAIDRAHRIGQTRPVTVLRFTVKDTVEDRILALQQKKRVMVASAFGEDETGGRQSRLTVEDLEYLFRV